MLMVGFGAGLHYFYKGFRTFREYRVLMDTPEIPIRSVAMGLVEIHGKARAVQPIASPVTRTPCCFYQVEIERWIRDKNGGHWSHAATDADGPKFYLEDGSGKVLVDAHHAEYDLIQTAKVQTGRSSGSSIGRLFSGIGTPTVATGTIASDADLFSYAQSAVGRAGHSFSLGGGGVLSLGSGLNLNMGFSERFRLSEFLVLPDHWYDLTGTCVENPGPQDEHDRNMIVKGTNEPTFLITWRSEKEIRRTLRERAIRYIFGGALLAVACLGIFLAKHGAF
jgi:hypothetical protein